MLSASMDKTAAVILAGGKSSRMGRNKALLPLRGVRLIDTVADAISAAGITNIYVSGAVPGYRAIPDALPHSGPVGGICACAGELQGAYGRVLFVPVDMPLLTAKALVTLLQNRAHEACYFEHHPLPCLLGLTPRVSAYTQGVHQRLHGGEEYSVKKYLHGLNACAIPVPAALAGALSNTNTPQEWREATHECAH
jgi:molybdopterin-guanine dinucleotide biosynthesis protein A